MSKPKLLKSLKCKYHLFRDEYFYLKFSGFARVPQRGDIKVLNTNLVNSG